MAVFGCRIKGDIASVVIRKGCRFNQSVLCRISSEARFADKGYQFLLMPVNGLWYIEGNPRATNLTAVNGHALPLGRHALKSGDVIGLVGRRSNGRTAMRLSFKPEVAEGGLNVPPLVVGLTPEEAELQSIIAAGWKSFAPEIDLTAFAAKTRWSPARILSYMTSTYYNHPAMFYVDRRAKTELKVFGRATKTKKVVTRVALIGLGYKPTASEYGKCKRRFDAAVVKALSCINGVVDEVEKALRLHDYLVRVCEYDVRAKEKHDPSPEARTAYSALVRGKAVCEGYAMAYRHLLNAAGIVSDVVTSSDHIWNYVRIAGRWYHVDVTFDDPVYVGSVPSGNKISHENFMMSDKKARKTRHEAWDAHGLPAADDERYDARYC
ncbi:MAG: hypothetical protein IJL17_20940 [Kiritimatiellae bacterium]|nr:hypothetical protein [Kiritimatiellia bacterium]